MDKVKIYLGYLGKYHFWVLCVVAILVGLFGWMMARGTLDEEFAKNKSAVTGKFDALKGVQSNPNPPNSDWTTALTSLTKQEQDEVATTWKTVYEAQHKVLAWPDIMPDGFKRFILTSAPDAEIPPQWCSAYQTEVIKEELPKLAKIVDAAPEDVEKSSSRTASAAPGTAPSTPDTDVPTKQYRVSWRNQDHIRRHLEMPGSTPSTLQVRLRQEDYWVYQALLNIIARTNQGSLYSSRVKVIEDLAIGANTAQQFEKGMAPGHVQKLATSEATESAPPPAADAAGEEAAPDQNRYLAEDGTILPAGTSQDQQFKRLPIYLKLVMDQREITRLLTECANYPLPVEVRQLRINPGGMQAHKPRPGSAAGDTAAPAETYDVTVEIHGIIYIYNPPDPAKLGSPGAETQAAG